MYRARYNFEEKNILLVLRASLRTDINNALHYALTHVETSLISFVLVIGSKLWCLEHL